MKVKQPARRNTRGERVYGYRGISCTVGCTSILPGCLLTGRLNFVSTECSESSDGYEYPVDIWEVLASYIRPEDVCRFALICRNAWTVTCTAAFWTRLYRR